MLEWLRTNIWTILIIAAVAAAVTAAIVYMVRSKKKGKSVFSCGGNCASCIYGGQCGQHEQHEQRGPLKQPKGRLHGIPEK